METKKISFGFSKLPKKTNIVSNNVKPEVKKVELIEYLEDQSIKVKGAVEEDKHPLVIPIKDNQKNLLDRIKDSKKRSIPNDQIKNEPEDNRPDSELSIDELAARQLMREAKNRLTKGNSLNESKISVLPLNSETLSLEGEKEPSLEDYESVPITEYGLALLRGMGWKEGMTIGKNTSKTATVSVPELRPKGLGLGATKVVQSEMPKQKALDKNGKELVLVKGAYAKVIAGVKKGNYCQVLGFDEEAGRVIVKLYPKEENLSVNEYMLVPVKKEDFSKGSKILNNAKYEEYLEISDRNLKTNRMKQESADSKNIKEEFSQKCDLDSEEKIYHNRAENKKYKSSPSNSPERDYQLKRDKHISESSDSEYEKKKAPKKGTSSKYRARSRSTSRHENKPTKNLSSESSSDDAEYYVKEKKSNKHTKSKYRDRSRDERSSKDKSKKDKKHKSRHRRDSSSESDCRKDKRKKNKCKSRHRRNSSSSSSDKRKYKSKR